MLVYFNSSEISKQHSFFFFCTVYVPLLLAATVKKSAAAVHTLFVGIEETSSVAIIPNFTLAGSFVSGAPHRDQIPSVAVFVAKIKYTMGQLESVFNFGRDEDEASDGNAEAETTPAPKSAAGARTARVSLFTQHEAMGSLFNSFHSCVLQYSFMLHFKQLSCSFLFLLSSIL